MPYKLALKTGPSADLGTFHSLRTLGATYPMARASNASMTRRSPQSISNLKRTSGRWELQGTVQL